MKTEIKYAPKNLNEIVYHDDATKNRILAYGNGALTGNIILHGPNGTGKTTVANLLPHAIDGDNANIEKKHFKEIFAQKNIGDYVLWACNSNYLYKSTKYYMVFHEFDYAKGDFAEFWTAADKCENLMLIITTNNVMNVHQSIRSRCNMIKMGPVMVNRLLPRAMEILKAEGVDLPVAQIQSLLQESEEFADWRVYCRRLDEMIYSYKAGFLKADQKFKKPALKIVNPVK